MKRRYTEGDDQLPLVEQFADPLALVPDKSVTSASEVEQIFTELESNLAQKDDWKLKMESIQTAMSYLKGGIAEYGETYFATLATGVSECVCDLRSALVRWGSLYTAACAQTLGPGFVSSVEILVPALFRQLTHGTAVIANSCKFALVEIAKHVQHRRTARVFLSQQNSRSNVHRQVVAEFVQIAMESWSPAIVGNLHQQFTSLLKAYAEDPSPTVRKLAKGAIGDSPPQPVKGRSQSTLSARAPMTPPKLKVSPIQAPPAKVKTPVPVRKKGKNDEIVVKSPRHSQIPLSPKMTRPKTSPRAREDQPMTHPIKKSQPLLESDGEEDGPLALPPTIGDRESETIEEYMPPRTHRDTERFLRLLIDITSEGDFEKLEGLDVLLPPSIISATQFLPAMKHWNGVFPILVEQFPSAFLDEIESLLVAFHFDPWLVMFSMRAFGEKEMVSKVMTFSEENAYRFFVSLLSGTDIKPALTVELKQKLSELCECDVADDNVFVIKSFLNPEESADNIEVITEIENALSDSNSNENLVKLFETLSGEYSKASEAKMKAIDRRVSPILIKALQSGNRGQIIVIIDFLTSILNATNSTRLIELVPCLVGFLSNEDGSVVDLANECLSLMLEVDSSFIVELMKLLADILRESTEKALALLGIIHKYFAALPDEKMVNYIEPLMQYLEPAFSSDVTSIRRVIVTIFVEFRYKIPKEFEPYMFKLHSTQQKLIELYSSKRSPRT